MSDCNRNICEVVLKAGEMSGLNIADLCDRNIGEDKTDSMLWLNFNKILKTLIWHEKMLTFMEDATSKVRIFL